MRTHTQPKSELLALLGLASLLSCAPTYPITSGFHAPLDPAARRPARCLVWSNHPKVEPLVANWVQEQGHLLIDPARVQEVLTEHHLSLSPTPEVEQTLLQVGKLVEAERVIVAAVTIASHAVYWMYAGQKEGGDRVNTLYDPTVTVRSLTVKNGEVMWNVTAASAGPIYTPEQTVLELTEAALKRASCETVTGGEWKDEAGCIERP